MWLRRKATRRRLAIIGLDCAEPSLLFERFASDLPTFARLREHGFWGRLESVIPAITVPAWSCMMSGQDPGALGIYGFRNRQDFSYDRLITADGDAVSAPRLWDILSQHGKSSLVLNVPGTYPPRPLRGKLVSCFLTPDTSTNYTYPPTLKADIQARFGEYPFDAKDFRTHAKERLLEQIITMTRTHFEAARYLALRDDWDFFISVEIGLDRIHHAFWRYMDETHRHYVTNSIYADVIHEYYRLLDQEIALLLQTLGEETALMVVSDHGAQKMDGGICLNEWLIREGYLSLAEPYPTQPTKLDSLKIDWSKTQAWGEGGYYGRLFLNIHEREPQGIIPRENAPAQLEEIRRKLSRLGDENGQPIHTRCFRPETLYPVANGIPPDLLIYFGNLAWRSIGSVGWNQVHLLENDTGPDDANHAQHGLIIVKPDEVHSSSTQLHDAHLLQIAPTVLRYFGLDTPTELSYPPLNIWQ
jgi:predicted AlkP superfamily phosphohydrolase/phosphomutase